MDKAQVNSLVVEYQGGNEDRLDDIFAIVNPLIERASDEIAHLVTDVTKFDCRIVMKVRRLMKTFREDKDDFIAIVKTLISREKADFRTRRSRTQYGEEMSMEFLAEPQSDSPGYQFTDEQANIEDEILFNEKITLLAQGDKRRKTVLLEWSKGANDKSISEALARQYGGTAESNRVFISRFKKSCCDRLTALGE